MNFKSTRLNEFLSDRMLLPFGSKKAKSALTTNIQHNYAILQLSCHMPFLKFTPRIVPSPKENGE